MNLSSRKGPELPELYDIVKVTVFQTKYPAHTKCNKDFGLSILPKRGKLWLLKRNWLQHILRHTNSADKSVSMDLCRGSLSCQSNFRCKLFCFKSLLPLFLDMEWK